MRKFYSKRRDGERAAAPSASARTERNSLDPQVIRNLDPITLLVSCGIVLLASIAIGTAMMVTQFRDRAVANSERELTNTVLLLARSLDQQFEQFKLVQEDLIERIKSAGIASRQDFAREMSGQAMHLVLKAKINALPHIAGVGLVGSDGNLINTSRIWPAGPVNVADREFFKALESDSRLTTAVSEPLRNRADGASTVILARRISAPNGEFLGLVLGSIEMERFEGFFESVTFGQHSSISLLRSDGMMLARHPRIESAIGKTYKGFIETLDDADARTARLTASGTDGHDRLLAAKRVMHFPLVVAAGMETSIALADWREQTRLMIVVAGVSTTVIAVILFLVVRQLLLQHRWSRQRLALEKQRLDTAIDNIPQGLLMFDASERIVVVNQRYIEMYGLSPGVVKRGCTFRDLICHRKQTGSFTGDVNEYCASILQGVAQGIPNQLTIDTPDGRSIKISAKPMTGGGWAATHEDITRQHNIEQERERNRAFLNQIIDYVPVMIAVKSAADRRFVLINRATELFWEIPRSEAIGKTARELFPPAQADAIDAVDDEVVQSNSVLFLDAHPNMSRSGDARIVTSKRLAIRNNDGRPQYLVSVVEDVTESKRADARIAHLAHHDALTDLPNRLLFREQLEQSLKWTRHGENVAVLYLDLDHFKSVNDTLGHPTGDELLKAVAMRLRGCLGETDTVARLGGDEFAIIQTAVEQPADVTSLVRRIHEAIREPYESGGHRLVADASIGIAIAPEDGTDPDQLLKNADLALYGAKAEGRGTFRFFEAGMDARVKARRALEIDLREAISCNGLSLHYQPIVNLRDHRITCCEALLRWHHPRRGMISPAEFIPVAEETGLITSLGEWVLRQACAEAAGWPDDIRVAVNVSPVQFKNQSLPLTVINALAATGLSPRRLELEITEAVLIRDDEVALVMLKQLRELGVRIAMDDFGTGYSSLSYLQRFPFDKIKIDRSFITNIANEHGSREIVQAVIDIARSRSMTTTAEGVETEQQLEVLRTLGCSEMQGYLFSPAVSAVEASKLLLSDRENAAGAA